MEDQQIEPGNIEVETRQYIQWPVLRQRRMASDRQFDSPSFGTYPTFYEDMSTRVDLTRFPLESIAPGQIEVLRAYWHALGKALAAWDRWRSESSPADSGQA